MLKSQITNKNYYIKADKDAFNYSIKLLTEQGFVINGQISKSKIRAVIPDFGKAIWRANYPELITLPGKKTVTGYEVTHQAIHCLVSKRYGPTLYKKPKLTMLSEALSGATELYYELQFIKNGGDPTKGVSLRHYVQASKQLKKPFLRDFNTIMSDPFAAFVENTLASLNIQNILFNGIQSLTSKKNIKPLKFKKTLAKLEHSIYLRHKDFPNFLLFVAAYCGLKSSAQDIADFNDCLSVLKKSTSFSDFIRRMNS